MLVSLGCYVVDVVVVVVLNKAYCVPKNSLVV